MATQTNLTKIRVYEEHEVINLYSTIEGDLPKGAILEYVTADPDNHNGFGVSFGNVPSYAISKDYVVNWKVQAAPAYSKKIAGILLDTVVTNLTDPWTLDARFADPAKLAEKQLVPSGRAIRFVSRGYFEVSGIDMSSGSAGPGPGSGVYLSHSGNGTIAVGNPAGDIGDLRPRIGTWMTSTGANGSATFKLSVPNN
jgi:hypothetical protein